MATPAEVEAHWTAAPLTAGSGSSDSVSRTPLQSTGTTVFLRDEGSRTFVPVYHQGSVTLRDLAEEMNISSVLECDVEGNVQPRAVAFDSPSDVLHSGHHYVARRDARAEANGSYVTFRGKILVKEYELEHPTPPTVHAPKVNPIAGGGAKGATPLQNPSAISAVTPLPEEHRVPHRTRKNEEMGAGSTSVLTTPAPHRPDDTSDASTISRALALSSERKRPREEATRDNQENVTAVGRGSLPTFTGNVLSKQRVLSALAHISEASGTSGFHDSKDSESVPMTSETRKVLTHNTTPTSTKGKQDVEQLAVALVAPPSQKSLRFIPFAQVSSNGTESYVTLKDLRRLCDDTSSQEEEFQRRHKAATDILEGARRVLFANGETD